ncbi:glycosyltransferase family 2 protein [Vibrio sp. 99-70-13A1]|uniref:glycosyltransferase family 2 protein n=1 Tax=Vibrio sp. 99-70-13A1 TaxID=2607601 RepID=UPI0014932E7D|nr:glycosyltransferase family 2 protein [Vibrio sp. 99-70-13A1]NOH98648.1 glycosyltransferase family 2 protein [Vibrio sp. 99-70-13A1]
MIDLLLVLACLISGAFIIYHHIGYPLLLRWYSKNHPSNGVQESTRSYKKMRSDRVLPSITILVPAFNEEQWISEKIRNLASLDYPTGKLKVIIACDGCTDNTVQMAEMAIQEAICCDVHFEIHNHRENRGKVALVNEEVCQITSDITALSDVSALISLDALLIASAHFSNNDVGVVNATYRMCPSENQGESTYWAYQTAVKEQEASLGSSLGAHGAFYLFRTELFDQLPANTINDDFILPMQIVKKGYVADYEPKMIALELEETNQSNDFKRRLRISAGNMQQVIELFGLFNPKFGGTAFAFFSGKGLRLLTPYLMIICFISSLLLNHHLVFEILLYAQLTVYGIGVVGYLMPQHLIAKPISLISYLVVGHYANFIGGLRYLLGFENSPWTRVSH